MAELLKLIHDYDKSGGILANTRILKQGSSIASEANKCTYYFPVLVSKNVTLKSASAISKALEFTYMSFMRACFAMTPAVVVKGDVNVQDYLNRFHQNIGVSGNKYMLDVNWANVGSDLLSEACEEANVPFELFPNESVNYIIDNEYYETINEVTIADRKAERMYEAGKFSRQQEVDDLKNELAAAKADKMNAFNRGYDTGKAEGTSEGRKFGILQGRMQHKADVNKLAADKKALSNENRLLSRSKADLSKNVERLEAEKGELEGRLESYIDPKNNAPVSWLDKDIKAKNAMEPLTSFAKISFVIKNEHTNIDVNIPIGVKTVIHSADPEDYVDRLVDAILDNKGGSLTSLVRWTSGEVNSLGDMLFGTSKMKRDLTSRDELSKWFKVIEERKRINKLPLASLFKKPFLPNMTMVISEYDARMIKQRIGVDLMKDMKYVNKLMKNCFLLSFIIMDESSETVYILYDGQPDFEELPMSALRRQTEKDSSDLASILKTLQGGR